MARGRSRVEIVPMPSTLLALTLAAFLMAPASFLVRIWDLPSGHPTASPSLLDKEGGTCDPDGLTAASPGSDAGAGWDPSGHS